MFTNTKNFKVAVTMMMVLSSFSLTACGKRLSPAANPLQSVTPVQNIDQSVDPTINQPTSNDYQNSNIEAVAAGVANVQAGTFKVDQATFSAWQAKGIAASGGTIYVTVADTKGLLQYGSVIKMNSTDGKSWKNIGTALLGLSHPIGKTVQGIAVSGGTLVAVDSAKFYNLDASKGKVKVIKTASGADVAAGGGSVFVSNGTVSKTDVNGASLAPITGLTASGGIGADNNGCVYAISGNTVKKANPQGQVQDLITTDLTSPVDVAVDNRNGDIYVLEQSMIKRFDTQGRLSVSFSSGASKPVAIAVDEAGAVYVADSGNSNKDSQVIKFSASTTPAAPSTSANSYNSSYSSSNPGY